jgi:mannose-6-phosphate isomerase
VETKGTIPLNEWCAARGADALGAGRQQLPYLVKILAAALPLSIQLHPDAEQAAEGYAREDGAGVARGDPQRSYSDPNGKTEAICALERFEALCGLRPAAEVRELVVESRSSVALELLAAAEAARPDGELAGELLLRVVELGSEDPARTRRLAQEITRFGERQGASSCEARCIVQLSAAHPGDRLLIAPLLLNHVVLEPGQALSVPPNTVHSYLSGTGVEVMTSSDNVVRGGLTRKHVDASEFARLLDTRAATPGVCPAPSRNDRAAITAYDLQIEEVRLSQVVVPALGGEESFTTGAGEPRILLCVRGRLELRDGAYGSGVSIMAGEAALIPARVDGFELAGDGAGVLVEPG